MTVLLDDAVSLTYAADVTVDSVTEARYLTITNDSQYRLLWFYDSRADDLHILAPYSELQNEVPAPDGAALPSVQVGATGWRGRIHFSMELTPGTVEDPDPPAAALLVEGFPRAQGGERRTVRQVAQGSITVGSAEQLQGGSQTQALTEEDTANGPALRPTAGVNAALILSGLDGSGNRRDVLQLDTDTHLLRGGLFIPQANAAIEHGSLSAANTPFLDFHSFGAPANDYDVRLIASGGASGANGKGTLALQAAAFVIGGAVTFVSGQASAGALGVPVVVAASSAIAVTITGVVFLAQFTPTVRGFYRLSLALAYRNSTPQKINVQAQWFDPTLAALTTGWFTAASSGCAGQLLTGAQANTPGNNQALAMLPLTIYAEAGHAISLTVQDGGGTPNSVGSAVIERLA